MCVCACEADAFLVAIVVVVLLGCVCVCVCRCLIVTISYTHRKSLPAHAVDDDALLVGAACVCEWVFAQDEEALVVPEDDWFGREGEGVLFLCVWECCVWECV